MGTLRLLVADDHDVVRKGVRTLLEEQPGWEVAAEASDGREAVEKAKLVQPDVTILDLSMPELNGLEAAREILKTVSTKVLILTMYDSDPLIRQTLEAGARGYLLKSDAGRDLVSAVDALRRNKTFFTPKVAQMVLEGYLGRPDQRKRRRQQPQERIAPDGAAKADSAAAGRRQEQQGSGRGV